MKSANARNTTSRATTKSASFVVEWGLKPSVIPSKNWKRARYVFQDKGKWYVVNRQYIKFPTRVYIVPVYVD